jgi:acyl transferase domain-containing protein
MTTPNLASFTRHLQRRVSEPIAIVGIGCRLPGAGSPEAFAELLAQGQCAVGAVPEDRWDAPRESRRHGGFLPSIDGCDAAFFGLSPREVAGMDPQQRLLLEVGWETLESAGILRRELAGGRTGLFIAVSTVDFAFLVDRIDGYSATGCSTSVVAGRLASFLDCRGPVEVVDTACSGSLVAVHRACESLRSRESDAALAGGVHLMLRPEVGEAFAAAGMLAPDGKCKTFDASADGYGRGEGCGLVLLKRLSDATADGDRVLALITGSAVNHNGRGAGLTAPSGPAQRALVTRALAMAGRAPDAVDYVEAHGTGTPLGDPQELHALAEALGPRARKVAVGSVKTNVGHLEAAAGIAGLLKLVTMVSRGELYPHLHVQEVNPEIDLDTLGLEIPLQRRPWPLRDGVRVGGVSSFGFSGTNAHVIVESAPPAAPGAGPSQALWTASARSRPALLGLVERWVAFLRSTEDSLGDLCLTANRGRELFDFRIAVQARSLAHLQQALEDFLAGRALPEVVTTPNVGPGAAGDGDAAAFLAGEPVDWAAKLQGSRRVAAPTYPFERRRYPLPRPRPLAPVEPERGLLGRRIASATADAQFECRLGAASPPALGGHRIYGLPLLPATGFVALMAAAVRAVQGEGPLVLEDVALARALLLPETSGRRVQVVVAGASVTVYSQEAGAAPLDPWVLHARARFRPLGSEDAPRHPDLASALVGSFDAVPPDSHYRALGERGMGYSGAFRSIVELGRGPVRSGVATGRVEVHGDDLLEGTAAMDAALQVVGAAMSTRFGGASRMAWLPVQIARVRLRGPIPGVVSCRAELPPDSGLQSVADVALFDVDGQPLAEYEGLVLVGFDRVSLRQGEPLSGAADLAAVIEATPPERRRERLVEIVQREVAAVIGLELEQVQREAMLFELGMSSLGSVELQYRLQQQLHLELPGIVFDYETVVSLADAVAARRGDLS